MQFSTFFCQLLFLSPMYFHSTPFLNTLSVSSSLCARNQVYNSVYFHPYIHRQHTGDKRFWTRQQQIFAEAPHYKFKKTKKTARAFWNKVSKGTSILRNEDLNVLLASFMSTLDERGFHHFSKLQSQLRLQRCLTCSLPNT
jgi:hypothetical protein